MEGKRFEDIVRILIYVQLFLASVCVECQECSTSGSNVFGGYQYLFYHGNDGVYRTFAATRAHCQSLGGDMPIITSAEQNDFIAMRLTSDNDNYYIGLDDMDEDGEYKWIDGTDPGYTNWDSNLYNDQIKPYCAVMRSSGSSSIHGRWNRRTCTSERRHICQIPIDNDCRWQELGESQYLIKLTPRATTDSARETCQSYGGDLAIIKTAEINTFLKAFLPPFNPSDPYLCFLFGLRRSGRGTFYMLDDTAIQYNDWYSPTEPNDADSWGCLGLRDGPSWYDQTSQQSLPYICERTRVSDKSSKASFGGLDYFTSPSWLARSFSDARTYCQYHGADLALIKSYYINTFFHVKNSGLDYKIFFGLTDQAVEGTFTWIDGTPLQYSSWMSSQPNDYLGQGCATLTPSNPDMGWVDVSCNDKRPFICERYQDVPENEWSRLDGTLYYISQSSMTSYSFARKYCQAQGGDLAQPKTEEINMHLVNLAGDNSYWFGLDDINQEGTFQWIDGTQLDNNEFLAWSNGDATLFENGRCVHQQVNNGWRKLRCTSYLRFACEKPPSPRQILPMRIMAATSSPYGGGLVSASFVCLLGSENEEILTLSTRRLARMTESITSDSYTAPGNSDTVSSVVLRQTLPASMDGLGVFECSAVTASRMTSAPLVILLSTRQWQPSDGRFTKTVHVGDDITLSVMSTTGTVGEGGIRWRKITDVDWANSLIGMSSGSLSHTIQSASVSDAGVYAAYEGGTLEQHQFSFIRLIVKECPYGRWNPPLCDRLCDNCYNGGVCHELSGTCICPPGHAGKNCLQACGMHKFGWDCEFECGPGQPLDKCAGSQICLPDPFGCTCLAGYTGIYCNETCADGTFGADCLQECHCTGEADCDDVTGQCPGDSSLGWSGSACQVPSVCPNGYFGSNCTQKCNCMNGTACRMDSGYCGEVEGQCDLGYVTDSVEFPANCMTFSGCFGSCSKTCHCSGGAEDCNFLTGDCLSSTCHPRWMGDQCQTDRFETSLEKTNPGVAIFSCSFTSSSGQNPSSDYLKAAVGRPFTEPWISRNSSDTSGPTLNISFIHEYTGPEEPIYCFIGVPDNSSEFAFLRLPPRYFFVLPSYNGGPEILEFGYFHALIGWRQWDPSSDTGEGPIVGYKIYVRSGSNFVLAKEVQPTSMVPMTNRSVSKRSDENATEMVMYNVSGLEAGSTYSVQIAAIRDGINGEGEQGEALTFTTKQVGSSPCMPESDRFGRYTVRGGGGNIWFEGVPSGSRVQVSVRCNVGAIAQSVTTQCSNGTWIPSWPRCEDPCSVPRNRGQVRQFVNGDAMRPITSYYTHLTVPDGTQLVARCRDPGKYRLIGDKRRTCEGGRWTGEEPECQPVETQVLFYGAPRAVASNGTVVVYVHRGNPNYLDVVCFITSLWLGPPRLTTPLVNDGDLWDWPRLYTDTKRLNPISTDFSGIYTCNGSSSFHSVHVLFKAAECEEPVAPEHGRLLDGSRQQARDIFPAGATVSFECEDDYRLVGSRRITCETDGQWSGDPPVCTVSRCPVLNIPDHVVTESIYFSDGRNIGDERIFNCVEGYVLRGDTNNLRCLESGVWSDPLPTCEDPDLQVRLIGGQTALEGRVEVFFDGSWGTVCDDGWDLNDASVICRMLGFQTAVRAVGSAEYGEGAGSIILDNVQCLGTERNLAECPHNGYEIHNCGHNEDAGAVCGNG